MLQRRSLPFAVATLAAISMACGRVPAQDVAVEDAPTTVTARGVVYALK